MIPELSAEGRLPAGVHRATWREVEKRFATNSRRRMLYKRLLEAAELLRRAGCRRIYINGSFVASKQLPQDIDVCWDTEGVSLDELDPVFFDFEDGRAAQKARFGCEFFPAQLPEGLTGLTFLEFFTQDRDGHPKGILEVALR